MAEKANACIEVEEAEVHKVDEVLVPETRLVYHTRPGGLSRECAQWDERGQRFLVSLFEGGMGAVPFHPGRVIHECVLVPEAPRPGLFNLGFRIDYPRNRVVCCASDKIGYLLSTVVAYDYTTWETLFVVELAAGPEMKSLADDLTIDPEGDIYVTDTYRGLIWKVKSDGSEFHVFSDSPLYQQDPIDEFFAWVKLNGIVYHPGGFLLVTHLASHALFKVSMDGKDVRQVTGIEGISLLGDGIVLVNNNTLAKAGMDVGTHLIETTDNWESATVTHNCPAPDEFYSTAVCLRQGKVFNNYVNKSLLTGAPWAPGYTCLIGQPIFRPFHK
eukprot:c23785_g1_i1 orf=147-1133(+)